MTLLYLLLTAGLGMVVSLLVTDPLDRVLQLYQQGMPLDRALPLAVAGVGWLGLFLNILLAIYGVVMDFGYRHWCLNTARGEQGELSDLLGGFSMVGSILWLRVLVLLYGFLWYLAIFMPAFLGVMAGVMMPGIGPLVAIGVFVLALVLYISRVLRYAMSTYCLMDEPDMGASWALRRSRQMMEGRVKDYVLLQLSFFGWYLLGGLIVTVAEGLLITLMGGVYFILELDLGALELIRNSAAMTVALTLASWPLEVWLTPYVVMTECKFYERIKGGAESVSI